MYSLQALKEYRDHIDEICASLRPETCEFFQSMEEKGINIHNDTVENQLEHLDCIADYYSCVDKVRSFVNKNQPLAHYEKFSEALHRALILTPQQVFETLLSRSRKTQEEVVKLTCKQYLTSRVLKCLEERDLAQFLSLVEQNRVDMTNVSKLLSLFDDVQFCDLDDELLEFWLESLSNKMRLLENIIDPQQQSEDSIISRSPLVRWLCKDLFTEDELKESYVFDLFPELKCRLESLIRDYDEGIGDGRELLDEILAICYFMVKALFVSFSEIPEFVEKRVREKLNPSYFRPIIERYEREWADVQREQQLFIKRIDNRPESRSDSEFSLSKDFFSQKNDASSTHMNLSRKVIAAGAQKFEGLLLALASEGYVDETALPLLAYRLSGCGTSFEEEIITWHKEPKVIRYIIATMHEYGTNWVSKLNNYFVDDEGQTFLTSISADRARNIKKLDIFRKILRPYYGDVICLS